MENFSNWTIKPESQLLDELQSSRTGLSSLDAKKRLSKTGLNQLDFEHFSIFKIFLRQLKSPFIYLLIIASIISFLLSNFQEGLLMLLFVIINTSLGFFQEYRAGQTFKLLKHYLTHQTTVIRNGNEEKIDTRYLVPGDVIIVKAGDMLPADVRFLEITDLSIDESTLTGESMPVKKEYSALSQPAKTVFDAKNMGFAGTTVINGKGICIVCNTGTNTAFGSIAHLAFDSKKEGSFALEITKFSKFIIKLIIVTLFCILVLNILLKRNTIAPGELFIFTLALLVTITPEALPLVITFSLARGARHLAKNKVIVKRLSAIEDLGSINVLCSDKTGTLTENTLAIDEIYSTNKENALLYGALALGKDLQHSNPFNKALWEQLNEEQKKRVAQCVVIQELPFDPSRLRTTTLVSFENQQLLFVMGAFEYIIERCVNQSNVDLEKFKKITIDEGNKGKRIIALAYRTLNEKYNEEEMIDEKNLEFVALFSFIDPIKKDAEKAIMKAKKLGLQIKILTGDTPEVAGYVAQKIGLIPTLDRVMTGVRWESLNKNDQLKSLREYTVFARVTPKQKLDIIELLQAEGYYVGYLGDGINDAPALKIANVALVVQGASDIAREAADIILIKKSLLDIVNGIYEGRTVFTNTVKYIKTSLSSIFGNFYSVAISSLFVNYLPMLPVQILLTNLLSDFPLISISTDYVDYKDLKRPKFYDTKELFTISIILSVISSLFDIVIVALFHKDARTLRTAWFIENILTAIVLIYSVRTNGLFYKATRPSFYLVSLSVLVTIITFSLPYTMIGQHFFDFVPLPYWILVLIIILVTIYFLLTEVIKDIYYHFYKSKK